jgi:hypothetical protein
MKPFDGNCCVKLTFDDYRSLLLLSRITGLEPNNVWSEGERTLKGLIFKRYFDCFLVII